MLVTPLDPTPVTGEDIGILRENLGITITDLVGVIGKTRNAGYWVNGERRRLPVTTPPLALLVRLLLSRPEYAPQVSPPEITEIYPPIAPFARQYVEDQGEEWREQYLGPLVGVTAWSAAQHIEQGEATTHPVRRLGEAIMKLVERDGREGWELYLRVLQADLSARLPDVSLIQLLAGKRGWQRELSRRSGLPDQERSLTGPFEPRLVCGRDVATLKEQIGVDVIDLITCLGRTSNAGYWLKEPKAGKALVAPPFSLLVRLLMADPTLAAKQEFPAPRTLYKKMRKFAIYNGKPIDAARYGVLMGQTGWTGGQQINEGVPSIPVVSRLRYALNRLLDEEDATGWMHYEDIVETQYRCWFPDERLSDLVRSHSDGWRREMVRQKVQAEFGEILKSERKPRKPKAKSKAMQPVSS